MGKGQKPGYSIKIKFNTNIMQESKKEYVIDFDKLQDLTGDNQKVIAEKLGVSPSKITVSKSKPTEYNAMMVKYEEAYGTKIPFVQLLKEVK